MVCVYCVVRKGDNVRNRDITSTHALEPSELPTERLTNFVATIQCLLSVQSTEHMCVCVCVCV